jgi:hypothetical protein
VAEPSDTDTDTDMDTDTVDGLGMLDEDGSLPNMDAVPAAGRSAQNAELVNCLAFVLVASSCLSISSATFEDYV